MIRFICPTCDKNLSVTDDKGGKIATCPGCKTRIIIPDAETVSEEESVTAEPPRRRPIEEDRPAPVRRSRDEYTDEPPRRRRDEYDDDEPPPRRRSEVDEDDDDFDRPRRKKRRKRRRRDDSFLENLPLGLDLYAFVMLGLALICLVLLGLSLLLPLLVILPIIIGGLMVFAGRIWFLLCVFQDDVTQGILCLLIGIYSLVYLLMNFDNVKKPFFLELAGYAIIVLAICSGGLHR